MDILYSALLVATAAFLIAVCASAPAMKKKQDALDRLSGSDMSRNTVRSSILSKYASVEETLRSSRTKRSIRQQSKDSGNKRDLKTIMRLRDANLNISVGTYGAVRIAAGLLTGSAAGLAGRRAGLESSANLPLVLLGICLGMYVPGFLLRRRGRKRKKALVNSMPDAMDLLVISTTAGLGFDASVMRIGEYDNSPLIQELKIVMSDVQHGVSKKEAYLSMAERCGVQEVTAFINAVLQSDELGVPIADVLNEQADTLRNNRRIAAEESANKAPVKMAVPLVLCIFPAIFTVLLGPAMLSLFEILG